MILGAGMGFSFIFNWYITKVMEKVDVGYYQYYISIVTFAMAIVPLGYQAVAEREAFLMTKKQLRKFCNQALLVISITTTLFGFIWYLGVLNFDWVKGLSEFNTIKIAILVIPIYALNIFYRAILQSQNKIFASILPDSLIRPILLIISALAISALGYEITPVLILSMIFSFFIGSLIYSIYLVEKKTIEPTEITNDNEKWFIQALWLLPIGFLNIINERIDVIMITKSLGPEENAVYGVAYKFALFTGFGLVILNKTLIPEFARHFKTNGTVAAIQAKIKPTIQKAFGLSLFVALSLLVGGEFLLSLFGKTSDGYTEGYVSILILCAGQLINVGFGSVGYILTMAKQEKLVMISIVLGIIVNIVLNILLLPLLGIQGAAISTSLSIFMWNVMMFIFVKKKTGINPTIIQ